MLHWLRLNFLKVGMTLRSIDSPASSAVTISAALPLWRKIGKEAVSDVALTTSPSSTTDRSPGKRLAGTGVARARSSSTRSGLAGPSRMAMGSRPPERWE